MCMRFYDWMLFVDYMFRLRVLVGQTEAVCNMNVSTICRTQVATYSFSQQMCKSPAKCTESIIDSDTVGTSGSLRESHRNQLSSGPNVRSTFYLTAADTHI